MDSDFLPDHLRRAAAQYIHLHRDLDRAPIHLDIPAQAIEGIDLLWRYHFRVEHCCPQHSSLDFDFTHAQRRRVTAIVRNAHPRGALWLGPFDNMIFFSQAPPLREIRDPAPTLGHDHIGPTLAHLDNDPPGG